MNHSDLPVKVIYNPILCRMPVSGQLYAISSTVWVPVPDGTTRADLPKYMTWEPPAIEPEAPQARRWTVAGSKGDSYRVEAYGGFWRCSCRGYEFRRTCRHISEQGGPK
jgi:hypothetical protein